MSNSRAESRWSDQNGPSNAETSSTSPLRSKSRPAATITKSHTIRSPRVLAATIRSIWSSGWKTTTWERSLPLARIAGRSDPSISSSLTGCRVSTLA
jgi:hypothetical protein